MVENVMEQCFTVNGSTGQICTILNRRPCYIIVVAFCHGAMQRGLAILILSIYSDGWAMTPLLVAAHVGNVRFFGIVLQHGASIHAVMHGGMNLLHVIASKERHDIFRQCIEKFPLEELESSHIGVTLLERAQENKRKEVAQLLKSYIRQARRLGGSSSRVPGVIPK